MPRLSFLIGNPCLQFPQPTPPLHGDGRYLYGTSTGNPFPWIADTNWELFQGLKKADADLYLADRAAKGFAVNQDVLLSKYNVTTIPNFYGDLAIDNNDPTQPNENYFGFVDWVTARAVEYGILICFVSVWGRYLGKRYPGIPKMLGGDTNGFWANNVPQACGITYGGLPVQQSYENISLVASPEHWQQPQLGLPENASAIGLVLNSVSQDWGFKADEPQAEWSDPRTSCTHRVSLKILGSAKEEATFTPPNSGRVDHDRVLGIKKIYSSC
ncbi:hypothetical protein ASPSYDRAFT_33361 [Aspergillus sydowii CBS 593.65]|uniref:Apiosidase-like catalytic domain-containing protein n=1 Tax=Aspergillus sydowii CBS 593.65 TaxID=1036612 RepID=A0A1L9TCW3_9EURO|nr:uncharacterized protein ASPSYDRAFT_33361 [Aspergillus sydowii CBS 593.65]OJJ57235.1 hypothetical protein ASPSYDRAFT_33361 [Aspergillus sydowii CBS 593.65]